MGGLRIGTMEGQGRGRGKSALSPVWARGECSRCQGRESVRGWGRVHSNNIAQMFYAVKTRASASGAVRRAAEPWGDGRSSDLSWE